MREASKAWTKVSAASIKADYDRTEEAIQEVATSTQETRRDAENKSLGGKKVKRTVMSEKGKRLMKVV